MSGWPRWYLIWAKTKSKKYWPQKSAPQGSFGNFVCRMLFLMSIMCIGVIWMFLAIFLLALEEQFSDSSPGGWDWDGDGGWDPPSNVFL